MRQEVAAKGNSLPRIVRVDLLTLTDTEKDGT